MSLIIVIVFLSIFFRSLRVVNYRWIIIISCNRFDRKEKQWIRNGWEWMNQLTRSSSLIISAMPGLISRSSVFDSVESGSTADCVAIGNSCVFMLVAWRPAAAAAAADDDDDDNGDKLLRFFGVADTPDCVVFVLIENSFDVTASEVRSINRISIAAAQSWSKQINKPKILWSFRF